MQGGHVGSHMSSTTGIFNDPSTTAAVYSSADISLIIPPP